MHISIIVAHPKPGSFSHAVAQVATTTLESSGYNCFYHDLHQEKFDPVITLDEMYGKASADPLIEQHCAEAMQADGFVIAHPNWWGQPPAILKGWIDRVMRFGLTYTIPEDDPLNAIGLLKAKSALVFNTSDTPPEREMDVFGDPLETIWKNCTFGFCGVNTFERRMFGPMLTSSAAQRAAWLDEAREMVNRHYPSDT